MLLLGLVYANIQPVITPVALIYFFVNYSIAKYQAIYILRPAYESGGMASCLPSVCIRAMCWRLLMSMSVSYHGSCSTAGSMPSYICLPSIAEQIMSCGVLRLQIWPRVHNQIMFCLILAQLVLVFILAIKKASNVMSIRCAGA